MLELIQFPWSPYAIVQSQILEFAGVPFKTTDVPAGDRSLVWRLTRQRYYGIPILKDGREVIFRNGQRLAGHRQISGLQTPPGFVSEELEGLQSILWRFIENEVEEMTFKLNDVYWHENVPPSDQLRYLRHKERKFGPGCLDEWGRQQKSLLAQLARRLAPFEQMLLKQPFLLGAEPRFVDFDLYGMIGNFLYSGHYHLPAAHSRLKQWHHRMAKLKFEPNPREKLRS